MSMAESAGDDPKRSNERQAIDIKTVDSKLRQFQFKEPQENVPEAVKPNAIDKYEMKFRSIEPTEFVNLETGVDKTDNISDNLKLVMEETDDPGRCKNADSLINESRRQSFVSPILDVKTLVIWRYPILTLLYFIKELFIHVHETFTKMVKYHRLLQVVVFTIIILMYLNRFHGSDPRVVRVQRTFLWCLYWFSLGMLSSIGLGTGVHTFALYLGPYIASVTVAANECGYLNFVEDSLQGSIECPREPDPRWATTLWNIMCKVRLESYMWGLGTAVGELPPYFMGRAARISRDELTDMLQEVEELERKMDGCPESLTRLDKVKLFVRGLVVKAGFWGILACASIPNPFFDLAGITCGNFLIPFRTFFGATLVGKAFIKTTIQQVFVILLFNKTFLASAVGVLSEIPLVGLRLQSYFSQYVVKQTKKYSKEVTDENNSSGWFSRAYHVFVVFTFIYFFISIINSLAQNHHKRLKREKLKKQ